MKVAVASDHRGYEAKRKVIPLLKRLGHEVKDFGCDSTAACDYPDFAAPVAIGVAEGRFDIGILFDGSGIGMSITANKICGIRAAIAHDEVMARRAREYNHSNVLCLGTDMLSEDHIRKIVEVFLETSYGDGRHVRRVSKVKQIEQQGRLADVAHALRPARSHEPAIQPQEVNIDAGG